MRTVYWIWSVVVLVMVVLQIGFAGYGAFYAAHRLDKDGSIITDKTFEHGFGIHIGFGYMVWLAGIVLLVLGLVAGVGRWRLGRHGVLALLLTLQVLLAWFGGAVPAIGAFHPINAFVILGIAVWIAKGELEHRRAAGTEPAPAMAGA